MASAYAFPNQSMRSSVDAEFDPFTLKGAGGALSSDRGHASALSLSEHLEAGNKSARSLLGDREEQSKAGGKTLVVSEKSEAESIFGQAFGDNHAKFDRSEILDVDIDDESSMSFADDIDSFFEPAATVVTKGSGGDPSTTTHTTFTTAAESVSQQDNQQSKQSLLEHFSHTPKTTEESTAFDPFLVIAYTDRSTIPAHKDESSKSSKSSRFSSTHHSFSDLASEKREGTEGGLVRSISRQRMIPSGRNLESAHDDETAASGQVRRHRSLMAPKRALSGSGGGRRTVGSSSSSGANRTVSQLSQMSDIVAKQQLPSLERNSETLAAPDSSQNVPQIPPKDTDEALIRIEVMNERHALRARQQRTDGTVHGHENPATPDSGTSDRNPSRMRQRLSRNSSSKDRNSLLSPDFALDMKRRESSPLKARRVTEAPECHNVSPSRRRSTGSSNASNEFQNDSRDRGPLPDGGGRESPMRHTKGREPSPLKERRMSNVPERQRFSPARRRSTGSSNASNEFRNESRLRSQLPDGGRGDSPVRHTKGREPSPSKERRMSNLPERQNFSPARRRSTGTSDASNEFRNESRVKGHLLPQHDSGERDSPLRRGRSNGGVEAEELVASSNGSNSDRARRSNHYPLGAGDNDNALDGGGGGGDDDVDIVAMNERHASRARQQQKRSASKARPLRTESHPAAGGEALSSSLRSESRSNSSRELNQSRSRPRRASVDSNADDVDRQIEARARTKLRPAADANLPSSSLLEDRANSRRKPERRKRVTGGGGDGLTRVKLVNQSNEGGLVIDNQMARKIVAELLEKKTREKTAVLLAKAKRTDQQQDPKKTTKGSMPAVDAAKGTRPSQDTTAAPVVARRGSLDAKGGSRSSHDTATPVARRGSIADESKLVDLKCPKPSKEVAGSKPSKNAFLKDLLGLLESNDSEASTAHVRIICPVIVKKLNAKHGLSLSEDSIMQKGLASVVKAVALSNQANGLVETTSDKQIVEEIIQKMLEVLNSNEQQKEVTGDDPESAVDSNWSNNVMMSSFSGGEGRDVYGEAGAQEGDVAMKRKKSLDARRARSQPNLNDGTTTDSGEKQSVDATNPTRRKKLVNNNSKAREPSFGGRSGVATGTNTPASAMGSTEGLLHDQREPSGGGGKVRTSSPIRSTLDGSLHKSRKVLMISPVVMTTRTRSPDRRSRGMLSAPRK